MEFDPLIALGGLGIGFLIGLTGMGGGSLMTPFLILMGVRPVVAVGTDLVQMTVTKLFGGWQHLRQGTVDLRLVLYLSLGSVPGALAGVGLLLFLEEVIGLSVDALVTRLLGAMLVVVGAILVLQARFGLLGRWKRGSEEVQLPAQRKRLLMGVGALFGLMVGMTSVGGGTLFLVVLTFLFSMRMVRVVGTDVVHAAVLSAAAGAAHLAVGNVDLALAGNVLVGTIPGVLMGSRMGLRLPEKSMGTVVAVVVMVAGFRLI